MAKLIWVTLASGYQVSIHISTHPLSMMNKQVATSASISSRGNQNAITDMHDVMDDLYCHDQTFDDNVLQL